MAQTFGRLFGAFRRLRPGSAAARVENPPAVPAASPDAPRPYLLDATTRTWWTQGAGRAETLVEAPPTTDEERVAVPPVAAMMATSSISGRRRAGTRVPGVADPAFSELLLVEMLRAGRFARAYSLLATECRDAWGSADAFARGMAGAARRLAGARILEVRTLPQWTDPERGAVHGRVAELEVDYTLRWGGETRSVRRTVHLVERDGRWHGLLFPPPAGVTA